MAGFEPTTTSPPARCATRLRYIPKNQSCVTENYNIVSIAPLTTICQSRSFFARSSTELSFGDMKHC